MLLHAGSGSRCTRVRAAWSRPETPVVSNRSAGMQSPIHRVNAPSTFCHRDREIGDGGKSVPTRGAHPRPTRFQIKPGKDLRMIAPPCGGCGGTIMQFISIGAEDQSVVRMRVPGEADKAHRRVNS